MPRHNGLPVDVLIGADSLLGQRSGVGRMTIEIARAARVATSVTGVTLLMAGKLAHASVVDELLGLDGPGAPVIPPRVPIPWKVAIGRVPGVQTLRRIKHGGLNRRLAELSRAASGRLVYHEPNMIVSPLRLPTVSTINDLSWFHQPSWHPAERLDWIDRNLPGTLKQARRFVAISEYTRDAVVKELGVARDRIDVVPLAPAVEFQPMTAEAAAPVLARIGLTDRQYVFSISTLEPRKNFDRLLTAHLSLPQALRHRVPLVIAGGKGWGEVLARPEADAAVRDGSVRLLGHVEDADLVVLCARAGVFAYVSLYEGFGLPVIEAMAAGTPVVASSTTAVGEVARGAAVLVDPLDEAGIAAGLQRLLEDAELATQLRAAGLERAQGYTWARTVECLVESWQRALT